MFLGKVSFISLGGNINLYKTGLSATEGESAFNP